MQLIRRTILNLLVSVAIFSTVVLITVFLCSVFRIGQFESENANLVLPTIFFLSGLPTFFWSYSKKKFQVLIAHAVIWILLTALFLFFSHSLSNTLIKARNTSIYSPGSTSVPLGR